MTKRDNIKNKTLIDSTNVLSNSTEKVKNVSKARKDLDSIDMSEISHNICQSIFDSVADKLDDSKALDRHMNKHSYQLLDNKKVRELLVEVLQLHTSH